MATLIVAAIALALGGCGGGGEEGTTSSTTQSATSQSAGGSQSGGEASIEGFGSEAEGAEREAILAVFTGYLDSIAEEAHVATCAHLSASMHASLARLVGERAEADCAATLPALLSPTAPAVARTQAAGEVTRVRVEGDRAFVVFKAPGAKLFQLTMVRERGEWKAAILAPAVLVPEL